MAIVWIILVQFVWMPLYKGEIVNVALNKPVNMSSRHNPNLYGPEMAVDGDTSAQPPSIIHTSAFKSPTWWWVNLQTRVQDATVKIYFWIDFTRRRNGTEFYTSRTPFSSYPGGQHCHSIIGTNITDVVSINCSGTWQYLMVYTNTIAIPTDRNPVLDFGEVQVLGCDGTYGVSCDKSCSSRRCAWTSTSCDRYTGECLGGCQVGWMGTDCTQECSSGMYGANCTKPCSSRRCATNSTTCDRVSGICPGGCTAGWMGTDCMEECSSGMYGANCTKSCSSRHCTTHSTTCDRVSGTCPGGCTTGWRGIDCMEECSSGMYGANCIKSCGSRQCSTHSTTCDRASGICPGGCIAGWRGTDCTEECSSGMYGANCTKSCSSRQCAIHSATCERVSGSCPGGCTTGWRGTDCMEECPGGKCGINCNSSCISRHCAVNTSTCNRTTGECPITDGCTPGWRGIDCSQECPSKTYGEDCRKNCVSRHCLTSSDTCDHVTGACAPRGCEFGWYGTDCGQLCPLGTFGTNCSPCSIRHCKSMTECPDDGVCVGGCEDGWTQGNCTQVCPSGTYGPDCSSTCGNCAGDTICHHSTGICTGDCRAGWIGDQCKQVVGTGSEGMTPVTGGVIGGLVGVIVTLAVVGGLCVCLIRQGSLQWNVSKSREPQQSAEMTESRVQQIQSNRPFAPSDIDEAHYSVLDGKEMSDKTYYDVIDKKYQHTYQNT